ncbi:MAG TPA: efflux RND transporter periplasmic adaptor subunit [Lacipirellulaceae bacterium]|nr:efflux RND transporter periplasmic adaptor subunit [Lacipirellulaceae bacterium]
MRTRIQWVSGLLLLACATVMVGAWQLRARDAMIQWDPIDARRADAPIPVRTIAVDQRDVTESIGGTAVTMPALSAAITIPVSSSNLVERQVASVNFRPGSTVKQGDVLLSFEPALFQQTVQQRTAFLAKSEQEYAAYVELAKSKAASAMQVREAEVAVETAKLELALARRDLQLCDIVSPLDGVVDELAVAPGTRVAGSTSLAVIHQLDPIHIQMDYPMERIDALELGQEGEVVLDAYSQEKFLGKVIRIAPVVSTKTRVLPVILEVQNPDNRIKAGISGFVRIKTIKNGATTVPSVAVIRKQQKAMVVCVEDNRAHIREVHTGSILDSGDVEILDGLQAGEQVVIHGQDALEENDVVNADWRQWTRREIAAR